MSASDEKIWQPTAVQNLVRYAPSGTYFACFRVGGKLVWKSLKTATFSVAKQRLPDTLRDHRSKIESFTAFAEGKMTVGNAADVYLQKVRASISLKPRSKEYRELMIDFIRRSWLSLFETESRSRGKRSDEQAAYFGLTREQAIELGRQAKMFTARALAQPFTIYTRWRQVFGPTRYYAIVVTADDHDLNELLVSSGLARIYGTRTPLPDGRDSREYLVHLHALENEAKAAKRGGWGMVTSPSPRRAE